MDITYWQQRWEQGLTGFHLKDVNPNLQRWLSHLELSPGATVLVPLCGKSIDLLWLSRLGYEVVGIEASELAIKAFFQENKLDYSSANSGSHVLYQCNNMHIYCGDYFQIAKSQIGRCDAVYDRAALVALPAALRERYVSHLISLLISLPATNTRVLLVALDYPQDQMQGPPFAVSEAEINTLFSDTFTVTTVDNQDILKESPKFQEQGLRYLIESTYLLSKNSVE